jgi:hypothetical protein
MARFYRETLALRQIRNPGSHLDAYRPGGTGQQIFSQGVQVLAGKTIKYRNSSKSPLKKEAKIPAEILKGLVEKLTSDYGTKPGLAEAMVQTAHDRYGA